MRFLTAEEILMRDIIFYQERKSKKGGGIIVRKYNISGIEIEIPTSMENYVIFRKKMDGFLNGTDAVFDKWYARQDDCSNVMKNIGEILEGLITPVIDKGIKLLNDKGVYQINRDLFISRYLDNSLDGLFNALDDMEDEIYDIDSDKEMAREYRKERKSNRARVVGYGYGFSSTIKAKTAAGAINMATGTLHSVGNMIGNAGSSIAAGVNKAAIYHKYKSILRNEMIDAIEMTIGAVMRCIQNNTEYRYDYLMDDGNMPDEEISKAIIQNYYNERIPDEQKLKQLVIALKNTPDKLEPYKIIWTEYTDKTGDLRKMAVFFDVSLESYILSSANEDCEKIFLKHCREYMDSKNPVMTAIKIESKIITAKNEIEQYCKNKQLDTESIKYYKKCISILEDIDTELRIVNGIAYDSREIAEKIRRDRETFYNFLQNHNIHEEGLFEKLENLEYFSDTYKNALDLIFQEEIKLRDTTKLFSNLNAVITKYFSERKTKLGAIEVARCKNSLEEKESVIRNIIQMPENEIPIMLIEYSGNGKSGILVTNYNIRFYSKVLFASENQWIKLKDIKNIECCGDNKYFIHTLENPFEFTIKKGLNISEQNMLCSLLNEVVFILHNLSAVELKNIKFINENSIKCVCGIYLPNNTNICTSCFKILTKSGIFAETVICKVCGNRVETGKKFCNKCGNSFISKEAVQEENNLLSDNIAVLEQEQEITVLSNEEAPKNYLYCPDCGNQIKIGKKFCNKCGRAISAVEVSFIDKTEIICSSCGNKIKAGKKFCNKCGKQI